MTREEAKNRIKKLKPADYRWIKKNDPELQSFIESHTSFLSKSVPFKERIYCILNDVKEKPLCIHCKTNPVGYDYKGSGGYKKYCSTKCIANSKEVKEKKKQTCIEKYGETHHSKTEEVKQKQKNTVRERYGVDSCLSLEATRERGKKVMKEKYGSEYYLQSEKGKNQHKKKCLERFNASHQMHSDVVKEKIHNTCMERYGVTHVSKVPEVQEKIKKTHIKKYGCWFKQKHLDESSLALLEDKNYLKRLNHVEEKSLIEISELLGVNATTIQRRFEKFDIKIKFFKQSKAEKEVANFLYEFFQTPELVQNDRVIISPKELDIVIPEKKIAIEYCGVYWHSTANGATKRQHLDKLELCKQSGYRLITIFEDEWIHKREICENKLLNILGAESRRIGARKTNVVSLDKNERKVFLEKYHIQGDGRGSVSIGLEYNGELVSVMVFKKRSEGVFELTRFASSCNVVGAFSKLLKHFQRNHEWNSIVSFADRRWSEGGVYEKNGFRLSKITPPDYRYVVGKKRIHKFNFRKNRVNTSLDKNNLTERELLTEIMGIPRIYDCGLLKFVLHNPKESS